MRIDGADAELRAGRPVAGRSADDPVASAPNGGQAVSEDSPRTGRGLAVLVADPDPGVQQFFRFVFRLWGVRHLTAPDGQQAAELLRLHPGMVTAVLADGRDVLAAVRRVDPAVPCWVMAGDVHPSAVADLLDRGAAGVLTKPFDPAAISRALTRAGRSVAGPWSRPGHRATDRPGHAV
jgi:CheY-like chemotaxis protein